MKNRISQINTSHPDYPSVLALRQAVLRRPLGLNLFDEDLRPEKEQVIFVYKERNKIVGCVLLQPAESDIVQLRQMAVDVAFRGKGIGRKLLEYAEAYAKENGYRAIVLFARNAAIDFYKKSNYLIKASGFIKVGIPHYAMEKQL